MTAAVRAGVTSLTLVAEPPAAFLLVGRLGRIRLAATGIAATTPGTAVAEGASLKGGG